MFVMPKQHPSILSFFFTGTLAMSELDREIQQELDMVMS
jgi:hypothetical protein